MDQSVVEIAPLRFCIRTALPEDAEQMSSVVKRSIWEVCAPDYSHDHDLLTEWCSNKTEQNFKTWINNQKNYFNVAETSSNILVGVGMLKCDVEKPVAKIQLCYILPEYLFKGVGKKFLQGLEQEAKNRGVTRLTLSSSLTAISFYLRNNYKKIGEPEGKPLSVSMEKELSD